MKRTTFSLILFMTLLHGVCLMAQEVTNSDSVTLKVFEDKLKRTTKPQVLDVRSPQEFVENHLDGAINFYVSNEDSFSQAIASLDKKKPVFVYSINNGRSTVVSKKLRDAGFIDVNPLPGGLAAWIGAGYPIVAEKTKGISNEEFSKLISSEYVVLVDVGSKHCGGCKKLEPVVDEISKDQTLKVVKIELYDNRELVSNLNIESVPTLILYKANKPIWKKSGKITKQDIQDALEKSL